MWSKIGFAAGFIVLFGFIVLGVVLNCTRKLGK